MFFLPRADELLTTMVDVRSGVQGVVVPEVPALIPVPVTLPAMAALFFCVTSLLVDRALELGFELVLPL